MWKIPSDATCVFSWKLFQVYQKEVEQFDETIKTFEWIRWFDIVKAICIVDEKVIILHEQQPWGIKRISLPWGMIDSTEDPLHAIQREVVEETGYVFSDIQTFCTLHANVWLLESYRYVFLLKWLKAKQETNLDPWWEKIEIQELSFDEFIDYIVSDSTFLPGVSDYIIREYILPGKQEEFKKLLFGN